MEQHSWDGFSTATELADRLVRSMGMSFRTAHGVIAAAVKMAIEAGRGSLTAEFINRAGKEVLGKELGFKDDDLGVTVSQIVSSRKSAGGGAPDEVRRMVRVRRERMVSEKDWWGKESGRISSCQTVLDNLIREKFGL
jgi:argininosuccinate lyase